MKKLEERFNSQFRLVSDNKYICSENDRIATIVYGSQNYSLSTEKSDLDTYSFIIPNINALIYNKDWISTTIEYKDGADTVKDVRAIPSQIRKCSPQFIEMINTPLIISAPEWVDYQKLFDENCEKIAHCDEPMWFASMMGRTQQYYIKICKSTSSHEVRLKSLANLLHCCYMMANYHEDMPYSGLMSMYYSQGYADELRYIKMGITNLDTKAMLNMARRNLSQCEDLSKQIKIVGHKDENFIKYIINAVEDLNKKYILNKIYLNRSEER